MAESNEQHAGRQRQIPLEGIGRPGAARLWHEGEQFADQCGTPGARAVVERRWRVFAEAIHTWRQARSEERPIQVLDAGCGDGINLQALCHILRSRGVAFTLLGLDYNPLRLERARTLAAADRLVNASLTEAPFEDESFDLVLCNHVIEHIPQPRLAVAQIARVLRRGGLAIVAVPNEGCAVGRLRNHVLQRSILSTTDHVNFFTRGTLIGLLNEGGLAVQDVRTSGFFLPHLRLSSLIARSRVGRAWLEAAGRALPSQAMDLIALASRSPER